MKAPPLFKSDTVLQWQYPASGFSTWSLLLSAQPSAKKNWRLVNPEAGSRKPYTITFDREMDGALLQDQLNVVDSQGRNLPGQVTVSASGKVWSWRPEKNWQTGSYQLVAGSSLEDVSGNRVGEALDHDAGSPDAPQKNLIIPFTIQKPIVHFRIMRFSLGRLRENNQ